MSDQKFEIDEFHRNVTDDELISDVRRVAADLGKDKLTIDEYNDKGKYHATTLTRRFSSWFTVLEKAGLKRTRNLNIPNEALFENLVEVWTKLGRQPRYSDLSPQTSQYSSGTYEKRFGAWRKALRAFSDWANGEERSPTAFNTAETIHARKTPRNINWRLRAQVLMRDSATCRLCGRKPSDGIILHVDHVVPWSKGGETVLGNLQILCEQCNVGKSDLS
jgi:Homing endonuclease associated repeat/HNH endonuclease